MGALPQRLPDLCEIFQISDGRQLSRELVELAGVALVPFAHGLRGFRHDQHDLFDVMGGLLKVFGSALAPLLELLFHLFAGFGNRSGGGIGRESGPEDSAGPRWKSSPM